MNKITVCPKTQKRCHHNCTDYCQRDLSRSSTPIKPDAPVRRKRVAEPGKPSVEVEQTYKKTVKMDLTEELVADIVQDWLIRMVPQFRGTDIRVELDCGAYEGCNFKCHAIGTKSTNERK